jgi:uncharacterized protein involved in response to NO
MTLAVMTRATRGHTGRDLSANHGTNAIYLLVTLAAVTRIAAACAADWAMPLLIVSAPVGQELRELLRGHGFTPVKAES